MHYNVPLTNPATRATPVANQVPLNLLSSPHFATNPALAFHQAMVTTNLQCHRWVQSIAQHLSDE